MYFGRTMSVFKNVLWDLMANLTISPACLVLKDADPAQAQPYLIVIHAIPSMGLHSTKI